MALLARSTRVELQNLLRRCPALPPYQVLRPAEEGAVMVRGRVGGTGDAFNVGEATVTRCSVQSGRALGHAYVLGRDAGHAELAARLDSLLQDEAWTETLERHLLAPLERRQTERNQHRAQRAAATQVEFFTMATMRS